MQHLVQGCIGLNLLCLMTGGQMEGMKMAAASKNLVHCWLLKAHPRDSSCQETIACRSKKIQPAPDYCRKSLMQNGELDHLFLLSSPTKTKGNLQIGII
uniref:Secreted protein n=1 Tax=Arundo donax TaxID=35708 RepID=A0A0A9ECN2_ARUDO